MVRSRHGEMTAYNVAEIMTIEEKDVYHFFVGLSAGMNHGFTFDDTERSGAITDTFDNGGQLQCEDVAHGLLTGDIIAQSGMQDALHNGITTITKDSNDLYTCDDIAYNSIDDTGAWHEGSYLQVSAGSGGEYRVAFNISGTPAVASKDYKLEIYKNSTELDTIVSEDRPSANAITTFAASGFISLEVGDRIFLAIENKTDDTNFTMEHANMNISKI